MYQFAREEAQRQGISVEEFYKRCADFVRDELVPLFVPAKGDDEETKKHKRMVKMVLFEVLHEDALAADKTVIGRAMLRPPLALTPFERIEEDKRVVYYCEQGATTLAYVFRKLVHTFYDVPEDRKAFIVTEDLRNREAVVSAARSVFDKLGVEVSDDVLRHYVSTDEGLPDAFRKETVEDLYRIAGRFARGIVDGTTDAEKLEAAEKLANLALMTGPHLSDAERTTLAALQRDAEGKLTASTRAILRARLHAIASEGVEAATPTVGEASLAERLQSMGIEAPSARTIGMADVRVFVGDMTLVPVDAVLVPQFQHRASVGGVGGAVMSRGGTQGLRAFDDLARKNGPLEHGYTQLAESGSERWPYVLNAVTVRSGRDSEFVTVFKTAVNALTLAGRAGLKVVALPALATGIDGRLSNRQSARAIFGALDYLASQGVRVPDVVVNLQDVKAYRAFAEVLRDESFRLDGGTLKPEAGEREFDVRRWAAGISAQMANQEDFDNSAPRAVASPEVRA